MSNWLMTAPGHDPYVNLALEEALMGTIGPGDAALFLWQNERTVVIGRGQNAWKECRCDLLAAEGGKLARRTTGGGAVFHDLGNLNFSFALSPERYDLQRQLNLLLDALRALGIPARFSGRNDLLTEDGRKFSGNAFRHTKNCSLQHGTLLVRADMEMMSRYLRPSAAKMRAKGVNSVRARVANLCEYRPELTIDQMAAAVAEAFRAACGACEILPPEALDIGELAARNASWAWNYGETPAFDVTLEHRFDWGGVEISLSLRHGRVEDLRCYTDAMDPELSGAVDAALRGRAYGQDLAAALRERGMPEIAAWLAEEVRE